MRGVEEIICMGNGKREAEVNRLQIYLTKNKIIMPL